jgi:hypothetical protein
LAVLAAFETASVEPFDVPNVSEALFVFEYAVFRLLLEARFALPFNEAEPVKVLLELLAELLVVSPATPGPVVDGPLVVEPTLPEVLPPLAELLFELEVAVSVAVPFLVDAAKAPVELVLPVALAVVARLPDAASVPAAELAEVAVTPLVTVEPYVAALLVAEFFEAEALNVSDALLLLDTDCAWFFESELLFIVLKTFDLSLEYDLLSVVEVFRDVFKLEEELLFFVTFEFASTDNWLLAPRL